MPTWKKVVVSGSAISQLNNDANYLATLGDSVVSSSAQIATDISGSFVSASNALGTRIDNVASTITLAADNGSNDTYTTGETLTFTGDNSISTTVSDNEITIALADGVVSSSAQVVSLVESGTDSNTFTDADHSKLDAIEAAADVTDTTNVTAAGALMDSELAEIATVKDLTAAGISGSGNIRFEAINVATGSAETRLNTIEAATGSCATKLGLGIVSGSALSSPSQGTVRLATNGVNTDVDTGLQQEDSPTFADLTLTGNLTVTGDRIEQQVTNLAVEDQFITINSGASAQDAGIFFEGQGASFGWDESENRFALDFTGGTADQTTITSDAYVAAVAVNESDVNYQKDGNIFVSASGEAYIYVS